MEPAIIEKRVGQYVALRDFIKKTKERHKEELKVAQETLEKLNGVLLGHLNAVGGLNVGTSFGTVYKTEKKSATIADMGAFWTYVVTQGDFDMVDKKANPTMVEEYIKKQVEAAKLDPTITPTPPPGVNWSVMEVVGVQRASNPAK